MVKLTAHARVVRHKRALLWPYHVYNLWRAGYSWREACRRFHWWVWYG